MVSEIERKFLLSTGAVDFLERGGIKFEKSEICEVFSKIATKSDTFYRHVKFERSNLSGSVQDVNKEKFEKIVSTQFSQYALSVSRDEFETAQKSTALASVGFFKYDFLFNNLPCNICEFLGELSNLKTLTISFMRVGDALAFEMPEFLAPFILREITDEAHKFDLKSLCLFGDGDFKFDFAKAQSRAKISRSYSLYARGFLGAYDAARVVLYGLFCEIETARGKFLTTRDEDALISLELLFRTSAQVAKVCAGAFDVQTIESFMRFFIFETGKLAALNAKNFLCTYLAEGGGYMQRNRQILEDEIMLTLSGESFSKMLKDYEFALTEKDGFYCGESGKKDVRVLLAKEFRLCSLRALKAMENLKKDKSALSKCEEFLAIMRYFGSLFAPRASAKIEKNLVKLVSNLKDLEKYKMLDGAGGGANEKRNLGINPEKSLSKAVSRAQKIAPKIHEFSRVLKIYYQKEN